jgi:hypothetical protein
VKRIFATLAITATLFLNGCGFFGANEEVNEQPRKAVFKSAEGTQPGEPEVAPVPRKVPGE